MWISDGLKAKDSIQEPSVFNYKFNKDRRVKTWFGGCLTILLQLFVIAIIVWRSYRFVEQDDPKIHSFESALDKVDG